MVVAEHMIWLWVGGGIAFLAGSVLLALARAADRRNYIVQRATPLPLDLVNERDDVWLRGDALSDSPVSAPHFPGAFLVYRYKLEEHVRRTRRTKNGTETYYTWETRETSSGAAVFRLEQGELSIAIDGSAADFKDLLHKTDRIGSWRHSLSYLPCPCTVSAVGSVGDGKQVLEPYQNIPLMVTPKERKDFIRDAERAETLMRFFGFLLFWLGLAAAAYGLFDFTSWPARTSGRFHPAALAAAASLASALFLPVWLIYVFNTFVAYRVRVQNAWRQVDVDIKMRWDLVPQLVSTVKGYMKHEQDVLEKLTSMRGQGASGDTARKIAMEAGVLGLLLKFNVVVEKYPDLKASLPVQRLMRELRAIEEKIAHGRLIYNEAVTEYNQNVLVFPRGLVARVFGFTEMPVFSAGSDERSVPAVGGVS
ncbi:MAG: LemA family protein [Planctomycetes bacterium]|nr:LemA family protein [Planctomycetota bacterium]